MQADPTPATARLIPSSAIIGVDDYPAEALAAGESGAVRIEVALEANRLTSRPTRCAANGPAALAARSCVIALQRWRYEPATPVTSDTPVPATFRTIIRWPLPDGVEARPNPNVDRVMTSAVRQPRAFKASVDDYPDAARRNGERGIAAVAVTIGTDGRVSACRIVGGTATPTLNERACAIALRRWRYDPAKLDGVPVPSVSMELYRWELRNG